LFLATDAASAVLEFNAASGILTVDNGEEKHQETSFDDHSETFPISVLGEWCSYFVCVNVTSMNPAWK
jgi:hypothetical protein